MITPQRTMPRTINRLLARTVGIQFMPARRRPVLLSKAWFTRMVYFHDLLERTAEIEGDVVECGVAAGSSLAGLASLTLALGQVRQVWGFDSWDGLPAPTDPDLGATSVAAGGMFREASTTKVLEELRAYGLSDEDILRVVRLVAGYFSETLPGYGGLIALLHIDVDLYQSYLECLTTLWPRVQPGGIVAFDEYGEPETWPGARRAVNEFCATHRVDLSDLRCDEASGKWWLMKSG